MSRPKFFRDPLHLQIRFEPVDLSCAPGALAHGEKSSWVLQKIIDTPEFQRLRFIRQNGLANLVFHGAEHSRFTHSLGVMHVARIMYERICRNMNEPEVEEEKLATLVAALIHDVGHGPFSHTMEEILGENGVEFDHEDMTVRFIKDPDSSINKILCEIDPKLPDKIALFFDKEARTDEHWTYRIVSSQMDADRLDYVRRDALFAGLQGHGFDIERIFDLLHHHDSSIAVDRGAITAVESYLVTIDQMYRTVYYHHAVRAATQMLMSLFRRAIFLHKNSDESIFPILGETPHAMIELIDNGDQISISHYLRLTDFSIWSLIDGWQSNADFIISDLSKRLLARRLFKTLPIDVSQLKEFQEKEALAKKITKEIYKDVPDAADYFVVLDEPSRTSYKGYNWMPASPGESIWLIGGDKQEMPLEDEENEIVKAFKATRHFHRLIVPGRTRTALRKH